MSLISREEVREIMYKASLKPPRKVNIFEKIRIRLMLVNNPRLYKLIKKIRGIAQRRMK